jgi:thiol-disulfide isomerase/thioredoxin
MTETNPSNQSRRAWLILAAAMAGMAGLGVGWWRHQKNGLSEQVLQQLWLTELDQPNGSSVKLSKFKGQPLVINFWATWCPPCVEEMPLLDAFYRQNQSNGWQVIGIAIDQPSRVRQFLADRNFSYQMVLGGINGSELYRMLGNNDDALPFTVVLGSQGELLAHKLGKLSSDDIAKWKS